MLKGLEILFIWLFLGLLADIVWANINYIPATSMSIGTLWLNIGIYLSLIHCIYLKVKSKELTYRVIVTPLILVLIVSQYHYDFYMAEKNCQISEFYSSISAIKYVNKIGYDPVHLSNKPYRLDWCKLGFEYRSREHGIRLIIVSDDGTAKLND
tara:strand:- start:65 stop:526 length:462 start_codon:yes stop_codon:yes gene_type:complete